MTEELKKKLLDFSNSREPFLTHNHMYTADIGDGSAARGAAPCAATA